jgi:hypothetical protein
VVILLMKVRGITMIDCDVILHASPFLQVTTAKAKEDSFQSQLIGGDTFDKELT